MSDGIFAVPMTLLVLNMHDPTRSLPQAQHLYAAASALCVVNTYLATGCLILLQLKSVIMPQIGR